MLHVFSLCGSTPGGGHHKLQAQDAPRSKNVLHSKLLYMLPGGGGSGPGLCWGRFVGECLVTLGAGRTVFPKHGSLGRLNQGVPGPTSREEAVGAP